MWAEMYVSEKPREFEAERARKAGSPVRRRPTLDIVPGKEGEFRYLASWLAASDWLDRLIAATDPASAPVPALSTATKPATAADTLRSRLAPSQTATPGRQAVIGRLAQKAGQALRRIGERLEAWGGGPPARETDAPYSPGL